LSHREIVKGVFLIDTLAAGLPGLVACYFIKGNKCALVDVGYPTSASTLLSELRALDEKSPRVDYLIPTHVHLDHAGAIGHLAKAIPEARVLVNEHGAKHLVDPTKLTESAASLFGKEAMSAYGAPIPLPSERLQTVRDLCILDLGAGKKLRVFSTPGHAWHHMSVFLENERLLITGDAVGLHYPEFDFPIPATPPPGFDADQYMKTLRGFMGMNPAGLLLPHFGPVRANVEDFLKTNLETIDHWVSMASESVKAEEPLDHIFESFIADIVKRSGRSREEIPDRIIGSIRLSAMGCYAYAQETRHNE
jgi:glyoxylase-like metal-dependent hydrolase (beta-lactamase superfamily II)